MKKSLLALAVLGTTAFAAHAESALTLYGIVDVGFTSESRVQQDYLGGAYRPHGTRVGIDSGILQGSRFGLKGTEDLGNGLKAIFQLENGFAADTGSERNSSSQSTPFFDRKAVVGLQGEHWGQITVGRQTDMLDEASMLTSVQDFGGMVQTPHAFNRLEGARVNNSVRYDTPNYGGFKLSAIYGFGETAGATRDGQSFGLGGIYANGPLGAYIGYFQSKHGATPSDADYTDLSKQQFFFPGTNEGAFGDTAFKTLSLGASYQLSEWRLYGNYSRVQAEADATFGGFEGAKQNVFELGTDWAITAPLHALLAVQYANMKVPGAGPKGKLTQVNLGLDYWLSKRTDIYAFATYQRTSDNYHGGTGIFNLNSLNGPTGTVGLDGKSTATAFALGMRHKF